MKRKMLILFFSIFAVLVLFELINFNEKVQIVKPAEIIRRVAPESYGSTENIAEGTSGTCSWLIDKDGNLIIWPTDEVEGTLDNFSTNTSAPWYQYREQIISAEFVGKIKTNADAKGMFYNCINLEQIEFGDFDTSNATSMTNMFYSCSSLKELDITGFNTSNLVTMNGMFSGCSGLKSIDFSNFDTTNVTNMLDIFGASSNNIQTIKLGEKMNFKTNENGGCTFGRGTWEKVEDGKHYTAVEICEKSIAGEAAGTYKKIGDVSKELSINFPVTYKIENLAGIDEFSTDRDDVFEKNNNWVFAKISLENSDDYTVPGKAELKYVDKVTDEYGNKFDLIIKIDNIHIYNLAEVEDFDEAYLYIANSTVKLSLEKAFYKTNDISSENAIAVNNNRTDVKYSVTINIVDKEGNPVEGSYIFSAYDLDVGSYTDSISPTAHIALNGAGYENYSEGINFISGFDMSSLKFSNPTYLVNINENRVTGTKTDGASEFSEFIIKADSNEVKFDWTAGYNCGTTFMAFYQPQIVNIKLQNPEGENLPGGDLELYYYDEKTKEWETTDTEEIAFLVPGEYKLKEVNPPENYNPAEDITFFVDTNYRIVRDGELVDEIIMINDLKDAEVNYYYYIEGTENPITLSDGNLATPGIHQGKVTEVYEVPEANAAEYYELVSTSRDTTVTMTEDPIDVIFYYRLKNYPYVVNYYDKDDYNEETGSYEKIIESKEAEKTYGETVICSDEIIPLEGYDYDSISSDSIIIDTENNTINIFYSRKNDLSYKVNYLELDDDEDDSNNNIIKAQKLVTEQEFKDTIKAEDEIITIDGYDYDSTNTDEIIISTDLENNVINIYYKKAKFEYKVEYYYNDELDEEKTEIHEATYLDIISEYTDKNKYGYRLKEEVLPIEVSYNPASNVMRVDYIIDDEQTKDISYKVEYFKDDRPVIPDSEIVTNTVQVLEEDVLEVKKDNINVNDKYKGFDFEKITLNDKVIAKLPDTVNDNDIIKVYYKSIDSKIIIKYVDKNDKVISENYVIDGKAYEECNLDTVPDKLEGYTLLSKTEDGVVKFDEKPREVIFKYGKDAKVIVNFVDINTDEVIEKTTIEGLVDDNYSADPRGYDGYELVKKPDNEKGKMTEKDTIVNYYYAKKSAGVIENHIDLNSGKVLYTETHKGNEGDSYSIKSKEFENYDLVQNKMPNNAEGKMEVKAKNVNYYYERKARVIVKYLEINTNNVVADEVIKEGHEGDSYSTEEKVLLRYSFYKVEGNKSGKMKAGDNEIIYYYTMIRVDQGTANAQSSGNGTVTTTSAGTASNSTITVKNDTSSDGSSNNATGTTSGNVKAGDNLPVVIVGIILIVLSINAIQILVDNKKY